MLFTTSTGRPLTSAELKRIRQIIAKHLQTVEKVLEPASVISSIADERLRVMQKAKVPLEQFLAESVPQTLADAITKFGVGPDMARAIQFGQANTGVYLQGFTDSLQSDVARTVNNAMRSGMSAQDTARSLWRKFGDYNRDWRMISVTEAASNANNGALLGRPIGSYVLGQSRPDACEWCKVHMHGKVLKVVEPPAAGQTRDWDQEIWVGKSNFGRFASEKERGTNRIREDHELWKPASIAHPLCRCRWLPFDPRFMVVDAQGHIQVKRG